MPAEDLSHFMYEATNKATTADALIEAIQPFPSTESDGLIKAPLETIIPVTDKTKHSTQSETTATAVVGPDDHTNNTKHPTQPETTANAVVGSTVTLSEDEVEALLIADIEADMDPFQYSKEVKQWIDIKIEPACSQEVERGSRLRRIFNVVAPDPNIDE